MQVSTTVNYRGFHWNSKQANGNTEKSDMLKWVTHLRKTKNVDRFWPIFSQFSEEIG